MKSFIRSKTFVEKPKGEITKLRQERYICRTNIAKRIKLQRSDIFVEPTLQGELRIKLQRSDIFVARKIDELRSSVGASYL